MDTDGSQLESFEEAARELGTDDGEKRFKEMLRKLAKPRGDKKDSKDGE